MCRVLNLDDLTLSSIVRSSRFNTLQKFTKFELFTVQFWSRVNWTYLLFVCLNVCLLDEVVTIS